MMKNVHDEERALTMVNTNIAPQWQLFNAQNWATLERAVRSYSSDNKRRVYVVTGTGKI
jgi:DNA/RNA endonuclease G (NUC1)